MISRSYFLAAWRTIAREPMFAAVNVLGLAVGLACCILMLLFVRHEIRYDTGYDQADRLYQVFVADRYSREKQELFLFSVLDAAAAVPGDVAATTSYWPIHQPLRFTQGSEAFSEGYIAAAGNFFRLMNRPFISGNAADALSTPHSLVITRSLARKVFGTELVLGRVLTTDRQVPLTIHGVIEDFPPESYIHQRLFVSYAARAAIWETPFDPDLYGYYGLMRLLPTADVAAITTRLNEAYRSSIRNTRTEQLGLQLRMRPLPDIHLADTALQVMGSDGKVAGELSNQRLLVTAAFLAGLVLLIAVVNFINMTIARAGQRRREVATRKALGAGRMQLVIQYLAEAMLLTFIALLIAVALVELLLPGFNILVDRPLTLVPLLLPEMWIAVLLLAGAVGLLAGLYPAWVLARLPAVASQAAPPGKSRLSLRRTLVFGQFLVTSLLIVIALTAYRQLELFRARDFGFDREVYVAEVEFGSRSSYLSDAGDSYGITGQWNTLSARMRSELVRQSAIAGVTVCTYSPADSSSPPSEMIRVDVPDAVPAPVGVVNRVDEHFLDVVSLPLLAGRNFSAQRASDMSRHSFVMSATDPTVPERFIWKGGGLLLTTAAAAKLGFRTVESAIGARVAFAGEQPPGSLIVEMPVFTVIGVTGNMLMGGGFGGATAGAFILDEEMRLNFLIKPERGQGIAAARQARETLQRVAPELVVNISYLPDTLERSLQPFARLMIGFVGYALLAIVISCLGLYAMTAFVVARRTREIGVRKVQGADTTRLTGLLAWDLTKPVVFALALALPVGHVLGNYLLQPFAERVPIGFSILGLTALIAVSIAAATVLGQSAWLASTRSSELLRYE